MLKKILIALTLVLALTFAFVACANISDDSNVNDSSSNSLSESGHHVHSYSEWRVTEAATCTETGVQTRTCKECGVEQERFTSATGHSYGTWIVTKAATCTETGVKTRTCNYCGGKDEESLSATGHSYGSWKTIKMATCTSNGTQERSCSCGEKETETLYSTGHDWIAATCTQPKKCSNCSQTSGSALGHTTTSGVCSRCYKQMSIAGSCTFVCSDSLPKAYKSSTYYEDSYRGKVNHATIKIHGMTSSVNSNGGVDLVFDCEVTYLWKVTMPSLNVQIIDPNGYTVATSIISAGGSVTTGAKYKCTVTVTSGKLTTAGKYTVKISET